MSSLRDQNKAKRRDALLDAAVTLLGTRRSEDITTEEIAALAAVAPATVYNLIGTRDDLLHALIERVMARLATSLEELDAADPIGAAVMVVDQTVQAFVTDSASFRQIVAAAHRSAAGRSEVPDPSALQVEAMRRAQTLRIIRHDIDAAGLGRQIFLSYMGALLLWSAGRLDDAGFSTAARHGLFTALAAAATDAHRDQFVDQVKTLGSALEGNAWHR